MKINDNALAKNFLARRKSGRLTWFSSIQLNAKRYCLLLLAFTSLPAALAYNGSWRGAKFLVVLGGGFVLRDLLVLRRYNTFWPFNEKIINWALVKEIAEAKGVPPVIAPSSRRPGKFIKYAAHFTAVFVVLYLSVPVVITVGIVTMILWPIVTCLVGPPSVIEESRFSVVVREVSSRPGVFSERISLQCNGDMTARLSVTDLNGAGFFECIDTNGMKYYEQSLPDRAEISLPVGTQKGIAICTISFQATTTPSNTMWHAEQTAETHKESRFGLFSYFQTATSEEIPLLESNVVSQVVTNWSGTYRKGARLPLANLGNYKIMVSAE